MRAYLIGWKPHNRKINSHLPSSKSQVIAGDKESRNRNEGLVNTRNPEDTEQRTSACAHYSEKESKEPVDSAQGHSA